MDLPIVMDAGAYTTGVGCRVVRGPDWKWNKQDGGEGHTGCVRRFEARGEAVVVWDSGVVANYRCGGLGFDLRVLDSSPAGVKHPDTVCEACHESPIAGVRWKCMVCLNSDLCSACYNADKHSLSHRFLRITMPHKTRVDVGRRLKSRKVEAIGIFPKARVVRGIDWSWGNQDCQSILSSASHQANSNSATLLNSGLESRDGGSGGGLLMPSTGGVNDGDSGGSVVATGLIAVPTQGRVTERRNWYAWALHSAVSIVWDSGASNIYRLGYMGLVDLKAIRPSKGGSYYVDHLSLLADLRNLELADSISMPVHITGLDVPQSLSGSDEQLGVGCVSGSSREPAYNLNQSHALSHLPQPQAQAQTQEIRASNRSERLPALPQSTSDARQDVPVWTNLLAVEANRLRSRHIAVGQLRMTSLSSSPPIQLIVPISLPHSANPSSIGLLEADQNEDTNEESTSSYMNNTHSHLHHQQSHYQQHHRHHSQALRLHLNQNRQIRDASLSHNTVDPPASASNTNRESSSGGQPSTALSLSLSGPPQTSEHCSIGASRTRNHNSQQQQLLQLRSQLRLQQRHHNLRHHRRLQEFSGFEDPSTPTGPEAQANSELSLREDSSSGSHSLTFRLRSTSSNTSSARGHLQASILRWDRSLLPEAFSSGHTHTSFQAIGENSGEMNILRPTTLARRCNVDITGRGGCADNGSSIPNGGCSSSVVTPSSGLSRTALASSISVLQPGDLIELRLAGLQSEEPGDSSSILPETENGHVVQV